MARVARVTAPFLESVLELPQLSAGEVVALIEGGSDREKSDEENSVTILIFVFAVNESEIVYLVSQISFCIVVYKNKKHHVN